MNIKAKLKATGEEIEVYKHREGGYVNAKDFETKYTKQEIEILQ